MQEKVYQILNLCVLFSMNIDGTLIQFEKLEKREYLPPNGSNSSV